MPIKAIISFILFLLLSSCRQQSSQETFVAKYGLQGYDTIMLVSSFSCGGCIHGFAEGLHHAPNKVFVYDSSSHNIFLTSLGQYNTMHVPQEAMDSAFGKFGNVIVLKKVNGEYTIEELAYMR